MDWDAVLERGQVLPRRLVPAQLRGLAPRVAGALPLLHLGLGTEELFAEGDHLVLVAVLQALVLAGLPEVAVDSEREEVLLVLLGRAPLAGPLLALLPVDSFFFKFCKMLILHISYTVMV